MTLHNLDFLHASLMLSTSSTVSLNLLDLWDKWLRQQGYVAGTVLERLDQRARASGTTASALLAGNIAAIQAVRANEGPEIVVNGSFADASVWIPDASWTIGSGVATHAASSTNSLNQTVATLPAASYRMQYTLSGYTSGAFSMRLNDGVAYAVFTTSQAANGTYVENVTTTQDTVSVRLKPDATLNFVGAIDNVSVKRILLP